MKLTKLLPLIGIILFIVILSRSNIPAILTIFSRINPFYFSLSLFSLIPIVTVKALKWKALARPFNVGLPFRKAVVGWTVGYSFGLVTPGRVGDLIRAYYLRDHAALGKSLSTVIIDRVMDVVILFIFALLGLVAFLNLIPNQGAILQTIILVFAAFIFILALATRKSAMRFVLKALFKRVVPEKHIETFRLTFNEFYDGLSQMAKARSAIFWSAGLGVLVWVITIFQYWMFALSLGISQLTFFHIFCIMPITLLVELIPISILGLGTRDATLIFFFSLFTLQAELAISFSLLFFIADYALLGLIGYLLWFRNPVKIELK